MNSAQNSGSAHVKFAPHTICLRSISATEFRLVLRSLQCGAVQPAMSSDSDSVSQTAVPKKRQRTDKAAAPRRSESETELTASPAVASEQGSSSTVCTALVKIPLSTPKKKAPDNEELRVVRCATSPPPAAASPQGCRCGICRQGPPQVQMVSGEDEDTCEDCHETCVTCYPRLTIRKVIVLCSGDEEFRQQVLDTTQVRKGAKARPSMPERVGVDVMTGSVVEKWYWHLTREEFIEEFKKDPDADFRLALAQDFEDESGQKRPGYLIDIGCGIAAAETIKLMLGGPVTFTHGRLFRRVHTRNAFLNVETMPTSKHMRATQGVEEFQQTRAASASMGPDFDRESVDLAGLRKRMLGQAVDEVAPKKSAGLGALAWQLLKATTTWMWNDGELGGAEAAAPTRGTARSRGRGSGGPARGRGQPRLQPAAAVRRAGMDIIYDPEDAKRPPKSRKTAEVAEGAEAAINIDKLPLECIVMGKIPKVGTVIAGVEKIISKWIGKPERRDDLKAVKAHLKMASAAASVCLAELPNTSWKECLSNLTVLSTKKQMSWPWEWVVAVTEKHADNQNTVEQVVIVMWPFSEREEDASAWVPKESRLSDALSLDGDKGNDAAGPSQSEAVDVFQKYMLSRLVLSLEDEEAQPKVAPQDIDWQSLAATRSALWQRWAAAHPGQQTQTLLTCEIFDGVLFLLMCANCGAECPSEAAAPHVAEVSYQHARQAWAAAASTQGVLFAIGEIMRQGFWAAQQKTLTATRVATARLSPIVAEHTKRLQSREASLADLTAWTGWLPGWRKQMRPQATQDFEKALVDFITHLHSQLSFAVPPQEDAAGPQHGLRSSKERLDALSGILEVIATLSLPGLEAKTVESFQEAVNDASGELQLNEDLDIIEKEATAISSDVFANLDASLQKLKQITTAVSAQGHPRVLASIGEAVKALERSTGLLVHPEEGGYCKLFQLAEMAMMLKGVAGEGEKPWDLVALVGEALQAVGDKRPIPETKLKVFCTAYKKIPSDWETQMGEGVAEELVTYLRSCTEVCNGIDQENRSKKGDKKKSELEKACALLGEWAGGAANGESWKHGIDEVTGSKTFKKLQTAYENHMAQIPHKDWISRKKSLDKALKAYRSACATDQEDAGLIENAENTLRLAKLTLAEGLLMDALADDGNGIAEAMDGMAADGIDETQLHPELWRRAQSQLR